MHGTCYYKSKKYCPVSLESCTHSSNHGYKWSIKGKMDIVEEIKENTFLKVFARKRLRIVLVSI